MKAVYFFMASLISLTASGQARSDIVISEIFPDPTPQVGLPASEWIELTNTSSSAFNLQNWRLADETGQSGPFPFFNLQPDSAVIICTASALASLSAFGAAISVTSFPSLNNDGEILFIKSSANQVIHAVNYNKSWYGNELKALGGWSLEMVDLKNPCAGAFNWKASSDPRGGTPGKSNSVKGVLPDQSGPQLLRSFTADSVTVILVFNEPLDSISAATIMNYTMDGGISFISVVVPPPLFDRVVLKSSAPLAAGFIYHITARQVRDCRNNLLNSAVVMTGLPMNPEAGEWVINEILFNPRTNGYDYVEFINNSKKILDLSGLSIANRNSNGMIGSIETLSTEPWYIFPGEYIVATEESWNLPLHYFVKDQQRILQMDQLPSFPDDEGWVLTLDRNGRLVDEVNYNKNWHFSLIADPEGISLERLDPGGPSQDKMNWHSASSTAGYGTPGYKNSQFRQLESARGFVQIDQPVISPDNDGRDDVLLIRYEMDGPGYMANLVIFDAEGRSMKYLVNNKLIGNRGSWTWDGLDDKGMKLPAGIYILQASFFNLAGRKEIFKKAVVIAAY